MKKHLLIIFIGISIYGGGARSQSSYELLGQKAMMSGNFDSAASFFEKAYTDDKGNMNALWLIGYSSYHAADYKKSIEAFDKLLAMKPTETAAYYYRGKAKVLLSSTDKDFKSPNHEKLLIGAIKDFSTAIDLNKSDMKLYQNRGLAYQEYGILKSQRIPNIYNKSMAITLLNSSLNDFIKVQDELGGRKDISIQIEKSMQILNDLKK